MTATLEEFQATGFPVGGEPLGVDLADTLVTTTDPATDLLVDEERNAAWWSLQAGRLPDGAAVPSLHATVHLRAALRAVLDAAQSGAPLPTRAVEALNNAAAAAPSSLVLASGPDPTVSTRWHGRRPGDRALAAAATSVIALLGGRDADRLRRCANPACSMLFVAGDARRQFCTQNICANRVRVARHYRRRHGS